MRVHEQGAGRQIGEHLSFVEHYTFPKSFGSPGELLREERSELCGIVGYNSLMQFLEYLGLVEIVQQLSLPRALKFPNCILRAGNGVLRRLRLLFRGGLSASHTSPENRQQRRYQHSS